MCARVDSYFMDRRVVIISAFVLAVLVVGLIWYQLLQQTTTDNGHLAQATPSPAALFNQPITQTPQTTPEESPDLNLVPPRIETKGGLAQEGEEIIEEEISPAPEPVAPTAATGFPNWLGWITWPLRLAQI